MLCLPIEIIDLILDFLTAEEIYKKIRPLSKFFYEHGKIKKTLDLTWVLEKHFNVNIFYYFDQSYVKKITLNDSILHNIHLNKLMGYYYNLEDIDLENMCPYYWDLNFLQGKPNIKIKKLNFANVKWLTDYHIENLSKKYPYLEELNISKLYNITNESIENIIQNSKKLVRLYICFNFKISDKGFKNISELKKLKYLNIRNTMLSLDVFDYFKESNIQKIDVRNCDIIYEAADNGDEMNSILKDLYPGAEYVI